eukprot:gnl/Hemi2/25931_TR8713_c1_g9_i1.p1 gnl/Hemi2/25931_TR8713_c1_g9~~gnl/Hemi2/25931_TR8713_c1_g9_i1.p1  ORF type:complete len:479 (-),score=68.75 gnl/Hemi2/25931_TR8713_c1_g9_i1:92-1528(-)
MKATSVTVVAVVVVVVVVLSGACLAMDSLKLPSLTGKQLSVESLPKAVGSHGKSGLVTPEWQREMAERERQRQAVKHDAVAAARLARCDPAVAAYWDNACGPDNGEVHEQMAEDRPWCPPGDCHAMCVSYQRQQLEMLCAFNHWIQFARSERDKLRAYAVAAANRVEQFENEIAALTVERFTAESHPDLYAQHEELKKAQAAGLEAAIKEAQELYEWQLGLEKRVAGQHANEQLQLARDAVNRLASIHNVLMDAQKRIRSVPTHGLYLEPLEPSKQILPLVHSSIDLRSQQPLISAIDLRTKPRVSSIDLRTQVHGQPNQAELDGSEEVDKTLRVLAPEPRPQRRRPAKAVDGSQKPSIGVDDGEGPSKGIVGKGLLPVVLAPAARPQRRKWPQQQHQQQQIASLTEEKLVLIAKEAELTKSLDLYKGWVTELSTASKEQAAAGSRAFNLGSVHNKIARLIAGMTAVPAPPPATAAAE